MKLNKIQKAALFAIIAFIALLAFILPFCSWLIASVLIIVLFLYFLWLNNEIISDSRLPSIFNDNRRNFNYLLLGSTRIWKKINPEEWNKTTNNNLISFAFFHRSLYADFIILHRVFSYLKVGGTVILPIDLTNINEVYSRSITYSDLIKLHEITLMELDIKFGKLKRSFPLLFYPLFSINYIINKKINSFQIRYSPQHSNSDEQIKYIIDLTNEIINFCRIRNLNVKTIFIGDFHSKDTPSIDIQKKFKSDLKINDIHFITNADNFDKFII